MSMFRPKIVGLELFFFDCGLVWRGDLLFCPFSLLSPGLWSWSIYNILDFEPLIFYAICNTLVLQLFMLHGILQLGFV